MHFEDIDVVGGRVRASKSSAQNSQFKDYNSLRSSCAKDGRYSPAVVHSDARKTSCRCLNLARASCLEGACHEESLSVEVLHFHRRESRVRRDSA